MKGESSEGTGWDCRRRHHRRGPGAAGAGGTGQSSGQRQLGDYLWALLLAWQPRDSREKRTEEEVRTNPGTTVGLPLRAWAGLQLSTDPSPKPNPNPKPTAPPALTPANTCACGPRPERPSPFDGRGDGRPGSSKDSKWQSHAMTRHVVSNHRTNYLFPDLVAGGNLTAFGVKCGSKSGQLFPGWAGRLWAPTHPARPQS